MGCCVSAEADTNATGMQGVVLDEAAAAADFLTGAGDLTSIVELSIKCIKLRDMDMLSKSDPFVVVSEQVGSHWVERGRTEIISNNTSPEFVKRIVLNYNFETIQTLKFDIYDCDTSFKSNDASSMVLNKQDVQGTATVQLAVIFGSHQQKWKTSLGPGKGEIVVSGEELAHTNDLITMQLRCTGLDNKDTFSKSDPFLKFSKLREDGSYVPTFKTEAKMNNLNPIFNRFSGSIMQMANGDMYRPLRIEVFDWDSNGNHDFIGEAQACLNDLAQMFEAKKADQPRPLPIVNSAKKGHRGYTDSGKLHVEFFQLTPRPSFLDYVKGGVELSFIVAIDFTASNGPPTDPNSLHYVDHSGRVANAYAKAIMGVGRVLEVYDTDKLFPLYGFGGKAPGGHSVASHCFALNGNDAQPEVAGVQGILDTYYRSLAMIQLSGPTIFSNVISQAAAVAASTPQDSTHKKYYVLLIITDGVLNDMDNTIESIIHASGLPLSILIVGVGSADFQPMEALDSDKGLLKSRSTNSNAVRDIVQFVAFNKFNLASAEQSYELAKELLAEIPNQVTGYYTAVGILPAVQNPRIQL